MPFMTFVLLLSVLPLQLALLNLYPWDRNNAHSQPLELFKGRFLAFRLALRHDARYAP